MISRRGLRGGGAHTHLFLRQTPLKSPLNWPKKSLGRALEPPAPLLFQILDPPLIIMMNKV